MTTVSLFDQPETPEDREAERDQPRPGVWAGDASSDLRALSQDETDALIRLELWANNQLELDERGRTELRGIVGPPTVVSVDPQVHFTRQRGGIDSDPLVRVLARRAWGDRDREWFELRGVRKGDEVELVALTGGQVAVAVAWPDRTSWVYGTALADARPGEEVDVQWSINSTPETRVVRRVVSDRMREPPVDAWSESLRGLRDRMTVRQIAAPWRPARRIPRTGLVQDAPLVPPWARVRRR